MFACPFLISAIVSSWDVAIALGERQKESAGESSQKALTKH